MVISKCPALEDHHKDTWKLQKVTINAQVSSLLDTSTIQIMNVMYKDQECHNSQNLGWTPTFVELKGFPKEGYRKQLFELL